MFFEELDIHTVEKDVTDPTIQINSPSDDDIFGYNAPSYDVTITDTNLDSMWYTLDDGMNNVTASGFTGDISQTEWNKISDGTVNIRFYANDSLGHESFSEVVVEKDLTSPIIIINSLSYFTNNVFGDFAPDYIISITEENLDSYWYTLDDGETNITISSFEGFINEFEWDKHGNGTLIIAFYAKDKAGNIGFVSALMRKDIIAPIININSPSVLELFGTGPPEFDLSILEANLESIWYSLDSGITTYIFTGLSGIINSAEWNKFSSGMVTITFSAIDSSLSENYAEVSIIVNKDVLAPIITVQSPQNNNIYGYEAPHYDLSIEEFQLDSLWYSLDYGLTIFPLHSLTGILDQDEWQKKGSGTVPIRFYANDSLGHESFTDVTVIKDLTLPLITINSPDDGEVFGDTPPDYDISISESNLDSYWYTLDGGSINISMSSFTGAIDQTEWDKLGNGTVTITFHAKDEGGNEGVAQITIRKDINLPLITINSPQLNDVIGFQAPEFDLSIAEPNIDTMWYTLDNGITTISFTGLTGTIDQTEWDKFGNGIVIIRFHIRDKSDNEAFAEVQVNKDLIAPVITITAPLIGAVFEDFSPIYSISIEEINLDSYWCSLDGGTTNITITALSGAISESAWNVLPNGYVILTFYAKDEAGNVGQSSVTITKSTSSEPIPPGIPGYDLYLLIGALSVISALLIRKRLKF